ncbi:MAG: hypothetical protein JWO58_3184 [Chitinophagaceae bacterium]|nr:hypothetical protein [Chitinophagaceae bacterium]
MLEPYWLGIYNSVKIRKGQNTHVFFTGYFNTYNIKKAPSDNGAFYVFLKFYFNAFFRFSSIAARKSSVFR